MELARSFRNFNQQCPHGWLVLSGTGVAGEVLGKNGVRYSLTELSVVGYPMITPARTAIKKNDMFSWFKGCCYSWQERQSFLGSDAPDIFGHAKIGVIGLSGGGSHVVQQLSHVGIRNLTICDADHIDRTNLNRLVGATSEDVRYKRLKTSIAARNARRLYPDVNLTELPVRWEDSRGKLNDCDLIVGCLDSFAGRRDLEAFCRSRFIPLIDMGMEVKRRDELFGMSGQVALSMPGLPCLKCSQVLTDENLARNGVGYGAVGGAPQVVWANGVLASTAVAVVIDLLTGWSGSQQTSRYDYDGNKNTIGPSNLEHILRKISCNHYPLSQAGNPVYSRC
jgi:molybdopterin/thiamine biosynthesis adenylyltransferase